MGWSRPSRSWAASRSTRPIRCPGSRDGPQLDCEDRTVRAVGGTVKRLPALPASFAAAVMLTSLVSLPASAEPPTLAPHADLYSTIQHIVVLFPENHSFDNYFG